ncbi:MAG: hypothetical protein K6E20_03760 [Acholeplasmatales bacterium]|nr:hypothetical protein [Acholeplasmatales bacterium]
MLKDLIIEFDEMGYEPTTLCPNPEEEANNFRDGLIKEARISKEQKELLDILKNKPFILQRIFEVKGLKNQKEFDQKYFWGTIAGEEEFKIMRWLDEDKSE